MSAPKTALSHRDLSENLPRESSAGENWWDYCPICNSRLKSQRCKYICSNAECNFFMSCSEFDR